MSRKRGRASQVDYEKEVAQLDAISRERALTDAESLLLERFLSRIYCKTRRAPYGNTKELARQGFSRTNLG